MTRTVELTARQAGSMLLALGVAGALRSGSFSQFTAWARDFEENVTQEDAVSAIELLQAAFNQSDEDSIVDLFNAEREDASHS